MHLTFEEEVMVSVFDWITLNKLNHCIFHVANERRCSIKRGVLLKRMGVLRGVPDIFITTPNHGFHGCWIEVKVGKNKPTKYQLVFIENRKKEGYDAHVLYGVDAVINHIKWYTDTK